MSDIEVEMDQNWKQRYRENMMLKAVILSRLQEFKGLMFREVERGLDG